ncbi:multidrug effflux MFS transporter [Acetobacter sp. AN02]|uniref:multidrug effflux MFS transporter n=1 Tax=Acetobacter sp. AN02 TaxID=2894186 RepID=UPI0024343671|nr:multidrug effflux MFS transporter [Acetobacter sp. AN02]MDG6094534.1 multidrug effflux MFS transporter [Acetobacter sp. AN02]
MSGFAKAAPAATSDSGQRHLPFHVIALLGLLTAVGPVATDMYLPAFPQVEHDLGHGTGSAQLTLAAWFAGLALGQFTSGPLSDRFGRRAPLIGGLLIFTLASAGCAITSSFGLFCLFRFLSALGGATGAVIPRAIVRDVATGRQGAVIMTQLMLVFGAAPMLAPSLGSYVLQLGSWRWIFWFSVIYALAGIVAVLAGLPDTLPRDMRRPLHPVTILSRYLSILREPNFRIHALIASSCTFVTFAYLGGAPVIFEHLLAFSPSAFALFFGVNAGMFILVNQISGRLAHRGIPLTTLMKTGVAICVTDCCLFLLLTSLHLVTPAHPVLVGLLIMGGTSSLGLIGSNATVMSFHHHGAHAGTASALLGTMQFSIGALSGILMGWMPDTSLVPTAFVMSIGAMNMLLMMFLRRGLPPV